MLTNASKMLTNWVHVSLPLADASTPGSSSSVLGSRAGGSRVDGMSSSESVSALTGEVAGDPYINELDCDGAGLGGLGGMVGAAAATEPLANNSRLCITACCSNK